MTPNKAIRQFFESHLDPNRPVLLGLSGGPDSLALFELLLDYRKSNKFLLAVAHVNHNYRPESDEEASQIRQWVEGVGIPFHEIKLKPVRGENEWRKGRIHFFKELCSKYHYQAVLLAHHKDDQAETVLKRTLEGAHLRTLHGLRPLSQVEGVTFWRPLLEFRKGEISPSRFVPFTDASNQDPSFLRNRMRIKILPELSKQFGKEVIDPLCQIAKESAEFREYLEQQLDPLLELVERGAMGDLLDLSEQEIPPFILKQLLLTLFSDWGLSREQVHLAAQMVIEGCANRWIIKGENRLYIDRKRLFWNMKEKNEKGFLSWKVVDFDDQVEKTKVSDWKTAWVSGRIEAVIPAEKYQLHQPDLTIFKKWWGEHKIPSFLRDQLPVIWQNQRPIHEFLTGESFFTGQKIGQKKRIVLEKIKDYE